MCTMLNLLAFKSRIYCNAGLEKDNAKLFKLRYSKELFLLMTGHKTVKGRAKSLICTEEKKEKAPLYMQ